MSKINRIMLIAILFLLLVLIRAYATQLFYDPFIAYFKNDYLHKSLPHLHSFKFFSNLFFRYSINSILSILIIYVAFLNKNLVKFSIVFFMIAFVVLSAILIALLKIEYQSGYLLIFTIRRFLIHSLFLILLLPIFYLFRKKA